MTSTKRLVRTLVLAALAVALCAALPLSADAAKRTKHGVTSLSPKKGKKYARGTQPTFKVAVRGGSGPVYFHVCKRKKRDRNGKLCFGADIDRGKKGKKTKSGARIYTFKPQDYDFDGYWLTTPGVYYWQAFRIGSCTRSGDCIQEGVIRGLRIK